jgi:hypothetical protein
VIVQNARDVLDGVDLPLLVWVPLFGGLVEPQNGANLIDDVAQLSHAQIAHLTVLTFHSSLVGVTSD